MIDSRQTFIYVSCIDFVWKNWSFVSILDQNNTENFKEVPRHLSSEFITVMLITFICEDFSYANFILPVISRIYLYFTLVVISKLIALVLKFLFMEKSGNCVYWKFIEWFFAYTIYYIMWCTCRFYVMLSSPCETYWLTRMVTQQAKMFSALLQTLKSDFCCCPFLNWCNLNFQFSCLSGKSHFFGVEWSQLKIGYTWGKSPLAILTWLQKENFLSSHSTI